MIIQTHLENFTKKTSLFGGTIILLNITLYCLISFLFDLSLVKNINLVNLVLDHCHSIY